MNREYFKSQTDFNMFTLDAWDDAQSDDEKSAVAWFKDECQPDSFPCVLIWQFDPDAEFSASIDYEYIYPKDFK